MKDKKRYLKLSLIVLLLAGLSKTKAPVYAQTRGITVSPPTIQFDLKPGAKAEKTIKITNHSSSTVEFSVNVQDFIVTDKSGSPELLPEGVLPNNKYAASTWATVLPDKFILKPEDSFSVTLYLQVPGNARPGGRYLAVAFKPTDATLPENSGAAINTVVGSLVYLTVEGKVVENARVVDFKAPRLSEYGPIPFITEIQNSSDIHINPKATVEVKDLFGRKVYSFALDNLNIFPGTSRIYRNSWETKWLLGPFRATLSGYYGTNHRTLMATTLFWVIPYRLIAIILLAVAIAITSYFYFRKRRELVEVTEEPPAKTSQKEI